MHPGDYHERTGPPQHDPPLNPEEKTRRLLRWLRFARPAHREESIRKAYDETFEWIFDEDVNQHTDSPSLVAWLKSGDGVYWIKGKPGSGKSTLMKMVAVDARTQQALSEWNASSKPILSSYYFWTQADSLENSDVGLVRSILCDLLNGRPELCNDAFPDWEPKHAAYERTYVYVFAALKRLVASPNLKDRVCVVIVGLDEYARDSMERAHLVKMIFELARSSRIKFLVSSRQLQAFEQALVGRPCLVIHHFTNDCIKRLIMGTLKNVSPITVPGLYDEDDFNRLVEDVAAKSSGVFLWALFAARTLADGFSMRDTMEELQTRLKELPPELEDLFSFILQGIPRRYRDEAYRFLRLTYHWHVHIEEPMPSIVLCLREISKKHARAYMYATNAMQKHLRTA